MHCSISIWKSRCCGIHILQRSVLAHVVTICILIISVKQQIARQCFIPFFRFFGRNDKHFDTPLGALILHWIVAAIWILATPNTTSGYNFIIGLFIYGQLVVGGEIVIPSASLKMAGLVQESTDLVPSFHRHCVLFHWQKL